MPAKKTKKPPRMFVAVDARSPLHCYVSVDAAVQGTKHWFTNNNDECDVIIYEVVPIKRVSRDVDVRLSPVGEIILRKQGE